VGNRELQLTEAYTNTYTYDEANRLTAVDSVTYTWDANGNLLDDGAKSYGLICRTGWSRSTTGRLK
jgi:hypothetical protein